MKDEPIQILINVILGGGVFIGGFILNLLWTAIKDLQKADTELAEKVNSIETLVAGKYVTRDEFDRHLTSLSAKLDKMSDTMVVRFDQISNKLDQKKDRVTCIREHPNDHC